MENHPQSDSHRTALNPRPDQRLQIAFMARIEVAVNDRLEETIIHRSHFDLSANARTIDNGLTVPGHGEQQTINSAW